MRIAVGLALAVVTICLLGCGSAVAYRPTTFRDDVTTLIANEQYADAVALLERVDLEAQLAHDGSGYLLIAEDLIFRPGVPDGDSFPEAGDWELPGTSDAIPHSAVAWQNAATEFATRYNKARWTQEHP